MARMKLPLFIVCVTVSAWAFAEDAKTVPSTTKSSTAKVQAPKEEPDPFAVPEHADTKTLCAFCVHLISQQQQYARDREKMQAFQTLMTPVVAKACEQILSQDNSANSGYVHFASHQFIQNSMRALLPPGTEKTPRVVAEIENLLKSPRFDSNDAQLLTQAVRFVKLTDAPKAKTLFAQLNKAVEALQDPWLETVQTQIESAIAQLDLIGQSLEIKGTAVDGKAFDLAALKGKIVLVDFWATWCVPCVQELPNVKANYEKYHAKGFEVVGISADETRDKVDAFLGANPLPWPILHVAGGQHPSMAACKVTSYPTTFLVGKDGKVVALDARGPKLGELLKAEFGE
jgi:thiol-disulfide isomerase/thioredoxin